jgi:hypothetical protein
MSEAKGKVYPWIEDEYLPAAPVRPGFWEHRDPKVVARERAEIIQAQVEEWRP